MLHLNWYYITDDHSIKTVWINNEFSIDTYQFRSQLVRQIHDAGDIFVVVLWAYTVWNSIQIALLYRITYMNKWTYNKFVNLCVRGDVAHDLINPCVSRSVIVSVILSIFVQDSELIQLLLLWWFFVCVYITSFFSMCSIPV